MAKENKDTSNNIIQFPQEHRVNVLQSNNLTPEQADEQINLLKNRIIREIMMLVVPPIFHKLALVGYSLDEHAQKDGALVEEALRSMLYKFHDIEHPFQALAEQMFEVNEDDDLTMVGNLCIMANTVAFAVGNN